MKQQFLFTGRIFALTIVCTFLFSGFAAARKIYVQKGADNGYYRDGANLSYAPGDTLVIAASQGSLTYFGLNNVHGTASNRVVIINEGGQVHISQHFNISNCTYLKITGSGSSDQYGFKIETFPASGAAIGITERSAHIEVERFYINNKTYGFWIKQEGSCDPGLQFPNWVFDDFILHDNKITNMGQEAMYLGSTAPNGERPVYCNGTATYPKTLRLGNFKIYNNIIDRTFRGGIQLSGASTGVSEIYNNNITNIGYELDYGQGNGIVLGSYTRAYVHDNIIKNTYSSGIYTLGSGLVRIENNRVETSGNLEGNICPGMSSIMADTRWTTPAENTTLSIKNNILGTHTDAVNIRVYNTFMTYNTDNSICNNSTIAGPAATIHVATGIQWTNCLAGNLLPVVNAGPDQTFALPLNNAQLTGTASDADGLITIYGWTQVSGPAPAVLSNTTIINPALTNLLAGTYIFRLTVTDNSGGVKTDDVQINVNPLPLPSAYVLIPSKIQAEAWTLMNGAVTENTNDIGGGLNVTYMDHLDWLEYNVNVPESGTYTLNLRISAANPGGKIDLKTSTGTLIAIINIPQTGWKTWQTISAPVTLPAGLQAFRLICTGTSSWDINWLEFTSTTVPPAPPIYISIPSKLEAESYTTMAGVQTESTTDAGGGQNVGYIGNADWMDYNVNATTTGSYTLSLRVASQMNGGQLQVRKADGTVLATVSIPNTGGWQIWQTVTAPLTLTAGSQVLRIVSTATAGWNFNWMDFTLGTPPPPPPPPGATYTNIPSKIEAENFTAMNGVIPETTTDAGAGQNLGYIGNADWMDYNVNATVAGSYTLSLRVASQMNGGQLQIRKSDGTVLATVSIPNTGGWQAWQTVSSSFTLPLGNQTLRVISTAAAGWNFNWLDFTLGTPPPPPPPPGATYTNIPSKIEAENFTAMSGVIPETTTDAGLGQNLGYIGNTDWMDYNVNATVAGSYTLSLRVASQMNGGQLQIRKSDGTVLATVSIPNTGGWQAWQTVSSSFTLPLGNQTLRVISTAAAGWNFNWMDFTSGTPPPPPPPAPSGRIEAEDYTAKSGVQTESTTDIGGGLNVGYIDNGDWMDYLVTARADSNYTINFRVATPLAGGQLQLRKADGAVLATVSVPNTGGWQKWQTVSATVSLAAGTQTIKLVSTAAGNWNINWIEVVAAGGTANAAEITLAEQVLNNPSSAPALSIYPNPVADRFMLKINNAYSGAMLVQIVNMNGSVVKNFTLNKSAEGVSQNYLSLNGIPKGQYILLIQMKEYRESIKLIKQ